METKRCPSCKWKRPVTSFHKRLDGLQPFCKLCAKEKRRQLYRSNPKVRAREIANAIIQTRKRRTGWTPKDFDDAWLKQAGRCAICDVEMLRHGKTGRSVACDHNHETKRIRKLLCSRCNVGLGNFRDSTALLQRAIEYLENN